MSQIFVSIFNLSIAASWLIGAVLLLRLLLKNKAPKWISCLLWAVVGLRLVIPFYFESNISLVPSRDTLNPEAVYGESTPAESQPADDAFQSNAPVLDTSAVVPPAVDGVDEALPDTENKKPTEYIHSGFSRFDERVNEALNEADTQAVADTQTEPEAVNPVRRFADIASIVWLCGIAAMVIYAVINYAVLKRRVAVFVPEEGNIRRSENVGSPFILGFIFPKIYLPFGLSSETEKHIIAHERAHLKRRDHWIKPLGYAILTVYWFNPLVWLAYILLCRDIEYACDEKVVKNMDAEARKAYASALLECGVKRSVIAACPVAFGEIGVKDRVKNALSYKKPLLWIIIAAVVICAVTAIAFFAGPKDGEDASSGTSSEITDETSVDTSDDVSDASDDTSADVSGDVSQPEELKSNGTLFINGKDISKEHYVYFDSKNERAMIPFLAIMEEFGATVTWIDENNANVHFVTSRNMTYDAVLNIKDGTFIRDDIDYFRVAPGEVVEYDVIDGEFLVNSDDCFIFFYYNLGTSYERDWENKKMIMYRNDYETNAKLIINGTDITENHHVVLNYGLGTAELPFVAIITNLGAQVTWINDTQAKVIINNDEYILDIKPANALMPNEASFKNVKTQTEYFDFDSAALLGVCYSGVENGEFFISVSCILNIETLMNVEIDVDYENAVVYVNKIEQSNENVTERISFNPYYCDAGFYDEVPLATECTEFETFVITNNDEFNRFISKIPHYKDSDFYKSFASVKIHDKYFGTKALIIAYVVSPNEPAAVKLQSIYREGSTVTLTVGYAKFPDGFVLADEIDTRLAIAEIGATRLNGVAAVQAVKADLSTQYPYNLPALPDMYEKTNPDALKGIRGGLDYSASEIAGMTSDELKENIFDPAFEIYEEFVGLGQMPAVNKQEFIAGSGNTPNSLRIVPRYAVIDPRYPTFDSWLAEVRKYFAPNMAFELFDRGYFTEYNNVFYAHDGVSGAQLDYHTTRFEVVASSDSEITIRGTSLYFLSEDYWNLPESELRDEYFYTEAFDYVLVKEEGGWAFSEFKLPY